jgi:glucose/arabinose dehydrogenase
MLRIAAPLASRALTVVVAAVVLVGCAAAPATEPGTPAPTTPPPDTTPVQPAGAPEDVVTGLASPWSILRVTDEVTLISQRDDGQILRLENGEVSSIGTVPGVVHDGEGGLLGLAFLPREDGIWLYAYFTAADDNRIVRMSYDVTDGSVLGEPEVILEGIAKAGNHDGGRIAFGPDQMGSRSGAGSGRPQRQDPADDARG